MTYDARADGEQSYLAAIEAKREKALSAIKREVVIGDCRLLLGDCLEILPAIGAVHSVVTDIPYEISQTSGGLRNIDYGDWDGSGSGEVAYSAMRLCSQVPSVLVFSGWHQTTHLCDIFAGRSSRLVAWVKTNPTVMNGQHLFLPGLETAYYGKLPGAWFGGNCVPSVWRGSSPQDRVHPTQKPLDLMRWCVTNTVPPQGICLDPFMGSGTTGVACIKTGRKFIGIELSEEHFETAVERVTDAYSRPDMFIEAERTPVPKQEAML